MTLTEETNDISLVELATELTIAWLGNPNTRVATDEVPAFLRTMHAAVSELNNPAHADKDDAETTKEHVPAVTVRKSLASRDHLISLIDGKPYKTLRRHLSTHGLTPADYRQRYGLKKDYPMVAPSYSEARSAMAHKIGLGSKGRAARAAKPAPADAVKGPAATSPAKRGRKPGTAKTSA